MDLGARQEPQKIEGHLPTLRSFVDFVLFEEKSICIFVGCWGKQKMQFSFFLRIEGYCNSNKFFFHNEENDHGNNENEIDGFWERSMGN